MTRVKICGITRWADAEAAIEAGADALGFIFEPSSPRFIGDSPELALRVPPFVESVAVFAGYYDHPGLAHFEAVQFASGNPPRRLKRLKVFRLGEEKQEAAAAYVDSAILLDAFDEQAHGGTGKPVDWDVAAAIVQAARVPVVLAGGLNPDNVAEAIRKVRPYAVDVSSGVESAPGMKDHGKVRAFIEAVREG